MDHRSSYIQNISTKKYENVTIILPAINETYLFEDTVKIILNTCNFSDISEIIAVVCKRTTKECLASIEKSKFFAENNSIPFTILWQKRPFAGGAIQDAIDIANGSHLIVMSSDMETDPHLIKKFIYIEKKYPNDIITASRWVKGGSFQGYSKIKLVLNFIFQKIFSIIYKCNLTDMTYGYRIFPTKLMKEIRWEENKHPFFLETALKPLRLGIKIHEIPTKWKARDEGESQNSFFQTFAYLKIALKAKFYNVHKILK